LTSRFHSTKNVTHGRNTVQTPRCRPSIGRQLKQWVYKRKLHTVKTPGGHHRIPQSEVDRLLHRAQKRPGPGSRSNFRRISGRNQLVGRIVDVRTSGLVGQVVISIGGQHITSLITADAVREMGLKKGQTAAALIKATEVMIIKA
jgi:molybdopterin-binding protein